MIPTVQWMSQKFAEYNKKYFGGKLPVPQFRVEKLTDVWGKYDLGNSARYNTSNRRITRVEGNGTLTLTNAFSRDESDLTCTLLHEMCHEYVYLILGVYPRNIHGKEFMSAASAMIRDGWNIEKESVQKKSDIEVNDENNNVITEIICVIRKPSGTNYKWWICRAMSDNMNQMKATASKIEGVTDVGFYKVRTSALQKIQSNPSTLFGWGGMTYQEAATKMSNYCGVENSEFSGNNLKRI